MGATWRGSALALAVLVPVALAVLVVPARGGDGIAMLEVVPPAGGAFSPNSAVVLYGSSECGPYPTVKAIAGKKAIAASLWRWPELTSFRPGNYFLLRPSAGEWPAGATLALAVSCHPKKLSAKISSEKDLTPPVPGAVAAPKVVKETTRHGHKEERLHVAFEAVTDASPIVCVRLRLVDPVKKTSNVVEGALPSGAASLFSLLPTHPACLTAGFVIDAAGHTAPIPAAACAKGMDPTLAGGLGAWCGAAAKPEKIDERWED